MFQWHFNPHDFNIHISVSLECKRCRNNRRLRKSRQGKQRKKKEREGQSSSVAETMKHHVCETRNVSQCRPGVCDSADIYRCPGEVQTPCGVQVEKCVCGCRGRYSQTGHRHRPASSELCRRLSRRGAGTHDTSERHVTHPPVTSARYPSGGQSSSARRTRAGAAIDWARWHCTGIWWRPTAAATRFRPERRFCLWRFSATGDTPTDGRLDAATWLASRCRCRPPNWLTRTAWRPYISSAQADLF